MSTPDAVTAAEIIRNFGYWQQQALSHPVTVTHHGRARVTLISTEEYERLTSGAGAVSGSAGAAGPTLETILEQMAEGFLLFDRDMKVVRMNAVAEAWFGRDRSEMLGQSPTVTFGAIYDSIIADGLRKALRDGEITTFEAPSALFPGRRIRLRVFPYLDGIGVLFVNITELERLRALAAENQACQQAIEAHRQIGMVRLDGRGRVVSADSTFEALSGFSAADLGNVRIFDIFSPGTRRRAQSAFEDVMSTRQPTELAAALIARQGGERDVSVSMAPLVRDFAAQGVVMVVSGPSAET